MMISSFVLAFALTGPGTGCPGTGATSGAFVGLGKAHVLRIDKVVPIDRTYQGYAVAFEIAATDHSTYIAFPQYSKLAPDMLRLLSYILGRPFTPKDSVSIMKATPQLLERASGPTFHVVTCAQWPTGRPFD